MPGKLYALAGLRRTSPNFYAVVSTPFRVWPGSVETFFGCIISAEPVSKVVSDHPNAVELRPGETLDSWWRLHQAERADRTFRDFRRRVSFNVLG